MLNNTHRELDLFNMKYHPARHPPSSHPCDDLRQLPYDLLLAVRRLRLQNVELHFSPFLGRGEKFEVAKFYPRRAAMKDGGGFGFLAVESGRRRAGCAGGGM